MKNSINLFLLFLGLIFASCEKEIQSVMTVQLNPTFITLGEGTNEPMKVRSASNEESSPIYAIQVYENDIPYYYGLFNDVSKMTIALTTSKTYKFKVTAYKTGTGKGLRTLTDADGVNYYLPNKISLKNMFIKGDLLKDIDLTSNVILNGQQKDYPEVDAFFSTKTITIDKGTTNIDITLLRMGFGLNLNVDALTSGNMEVYLGNDTIKLNSSQTTASTVRLFNVLNGNFTNIHSKADTYGDSILLKVKWTGTNGTIVNTQRKYFFNRNYQKTINIQMNTLTGGLSFENWKFPLDGLIAWFPFNGNANDESGNGYNGIVNGATLTSDRFGYSNNAYNFSGSTLINTNKPGVVNNKSRTVSCWFNNSQISSSGNTAVLVSFGATAAVGSAFSLCLYRDNAMYYIDMDIASSNVIYNSPISQNTWYMFTATYDNLDGNTASNIKIYLNGVLLSSVRSKLNPSATINTSSSTNVGIGNIPNVTIHSYYGKIDDVGIWNRALSPEEIYSLYNVKY